MVAVHKHISVKSEDGNLSIEKSQLENDHRMEIKIDGNSVWNNSENSKLENSNSWDTTGASNFIANNTFESKNDDNINGLKHDWKNETGDSSHNPIKKEDIDAEISDAAFANTHSKSKFSKKCNLGNPAKDIFII